MSRVRIQRRRQSRGKKALSKKEGRKELIRERSRRGGTLESEIQARRKKRGKPPLTPKELIKEVRREKLRGGRAS